MPCLMDGGLKITRGLDSLLWPCGSLGSNSGDSACSHLIGYSTHFKNSVSLSLSLSLWCKRVCAQVCISVPTCACVESRGQH